MSRPLPRPRRLLLGSIAPLWIAAVGVALASDIGCASGPSSGGAPDGAAAVDATAGPLDGGSVDATSATSDAGPGGEPDGDARTEDDARVGDAGGYGADAASQDAGAQSEADGGAGAGDASPGLVYALPPPRQCDNQFFVSGCQAGVDASACGGVCASANACSDGPRAKPGGDVGFACPRFMLFSDEMLQAAKDDWQADEPPFHYAVVGHDPDTGGIDGDAGTCCQCYQIVFDRPSPSMDDEACVNGDCSRGSAVTAPPPLIAQAFNLGATTTTFDVFMGAGGFGANNACDPAGTPQDQSGLYAYTAFPDAGEPSGGGVKVVLQEGPWPAACKTSVNLLTDATLSSSACQAQVAAACGAVRATSSAVAAETTRSCAEANAPGTFYHLNWQVFVKKVECPSHLTDVTGCKLAGQGLPAAAPGVTAAEAGADPSWRVYTTTTMQDCCKPSCAWRDNVGGKGLATGTLYNSFYTCDQSGTPVTE